MRHLDGSFFLVTTIGWSHIAGSFASLAGSIMPWRSCASISSSNARRKLIGTCLVDQHCCGRAPGMVLIVASPPLMGRHTPSRVCGNSARSCCHSLLVRPLSSSSPVLGVGGLSCGGPPVGGLFTGLCLGSLLLSTGFPGVPDLVLSEVGFPGGLCLVRGVLAWWVVWRSCVGLGWAEVVLEAGLAWRHWVFGCGRISKSRVASLDSRGCRTRRAT